MENKEKDISEMECRFTFEQIKEMVQKFYPDMAEGEVNYHAYHIKDNDWLKVTDDENELEITIREQVEPDDD